MGLLIATRALQRDNRPAGTRYALPGAEENLEAVGKRAAHFRRVRGTYLNLVGQLALAARQLRAEQVALAGMPAHDFAG